MFVPMESDVVLLYVATALGYVLHKTKSMSHPLLFICLPVC